MDLKIINLNSETATKQELINAIANNQKDSSNYEKILLRIKLELYREAMNINQLFDETTTKEDLLNVLIDDQFIIPDEEINEFIKDVTLNKSS